MTQYVGWCQCLWLVLTLVQMTALPGTLCCLLGLACMAVATQLGVICLTCYLFDCTGVQADELVLALGANPTTTTLSQLLLGCSSYVMDDDSLLSVLGQQQVRSLQGELVTSWLLQQTTPSHNDLLGSDRVLPFVAQLKQLLVITSSWLPGQLIQTLLLGGVKGVVSATDAHGPASVAPDMVSAFFTVLYQHLFDGDTVLKAIQAAETAHEALKGMYKFW